MIKMFVFQCLLFKSKDRLHRFFGVCSWVNLGLLMFALINLIRTIR